MDSNDTKPLLTLIEEIPEFGVYIISALMQQQCVREFSITRSGASVIEGDSGDAWVRRFRMKLSDDEETLTITVRDQ